MPSDERNAETVGDRRHLHSVRGDDRQRRLNDVARRQWGVVTAADLLVVGLSEPAIRRWTASGRLHRLHRGVYALAPSAALAPHGRELAAVLACGAAAVLAFVSAALRWALLRYPPPKHHVLIASTGRRSPRGIVLHVTTDLPDTDRTTHQGVPITTVERTILDLAASPDLSDRAVEAAAAQAERDGRFHRSVQLRVAARSRDRTGAARLQTILRIGPRLWRSEEEALAAAALVAANLPEPVIAHEVRTDIGMVEVDLCLPDARLIIEVDGRQHALPLQRGRDEDRDAALARAGWRTVRVSAADARHRPHALVATVRAALVGSRA